MTPLEHYYNQHSEPTRTCLLALRDIILAQDEAISAAWKYGMPFFCYNNKMFCYLWYHKKLQQPYIGFVEGKHLLSPKLLQEKRSRMKILLLDAHKDLPIKLINQLLVQAINLYKNGTIVL